MSRNSYLNATKLIKMCRVCFTQSNNIMFDLNEEMDLDNETEIPILDALQKVVCAKVLFNNDFPRCICPMCISILKISYKFVTQFEETQNELRRKTGVASVCYELPIRQKQLKKMVTFNEGKGEVPVEIIFGQAKYDLKDVFIVENPEKEQCNYNAFLKNLGQEVSATFANEAENKILTKGENGNEVSVFMALNENNVLPVKELKIDGETNMIDSIVLEEPQYKEEPDTENYDDMEDAAHEEDIESFILQIGDDKPEGNEKNKENKYVLQQPIRRPKRKKKLIKEREFDGMIIMEPINAAVEKEKPCENDDDDDIFEREMQFPCETCKKIFPNKRSLTAHVKRTHFPKTSKYTCEICGYQNNTRSGYVHHQVKHKGKQFICEICSKTYYTRAVLKVHMATHTNKRQHLCNVCGKGFNYPNALVYHMRLHTGEKKYKCEYCGETFRMPNSLKRHIRTHTGERPYKCNFCERAFCSKGEVQCHEHIHTGYRPYRCKHCWKGFTKTHNLKLHLLSHNGPHKCNICNKTFIEMAILNMHYKIAHKDMLEKGEDSAEDESDQ